MNTPTFKNLSRLLEKWPVDVSKKGRDFGEYLRFHVGKSFSGPPSQIDFNCWDEISTILSRIASNKYKLAYPVHRYVSSTGLTGEECGKAVSNEFIELLTEEESRAGIKKYFRIKFRD